MPAARMTRLVSVLVLACLLCTFGVAACTSSHRDDDTGPINFAGIADFTDGDQVGKAVAQWNKVHPDQRVTYIEQSESSDEQRSQLVATAQGALDAQEPTECYDVHSLDVMWTAEFAKGNLVVPLGNEARRDGIEEKLFVPAAWDSGRYEKKQWAVPFLINVPLLFYRKDILDAEKLPPPTSLKDMIAKITLVNQRRAAGGQNPIGGFGGQFARYEGLTVNALEIVRALGGDITADPHQPISDESHVQEAFRQLVSALAEGGWIPREALTYQEQSSREAFVNGQLLFMRNWPYAYKLLTAANSPMAGKVGVVALPWPEVFGGHNLAVSSCSKHQSTAWSFISYLTTDPGVQSAMLRDGGYPPVLKAAYNPRRDEFTKAISQALTGKQNAVSRPVTPYYAAVSDVIQDEVSHVLRDHLAPADAVEHLNTRLPPALHGK